MTDDEDRDEEEFQQVVDEALKAMGQQLKTQAAIREDFVLARLEEEIIRLRPFCEQLKSGRFNAGLKEKPTEKP